MTKKLISIRIAEITDEQITALQASTGLNQTQIISTAIDRMAREEITMNRTEIDNLFGSEATDDNLKYMGKNWTLGDVKGYLSETGYTGNAKEILGWLRNFAKNN